MLGIIILITLIGMKSKIFEYTSVMTKEVLIKVEMNKLSKSDNDCFVIESYLP